MRCLAFLFTFLTAFAQNTFTNPILPTGPDPWVVYENGHYYLTRSAGTRIVLYTATTLAGIKGSKPITVWTPPANTAYSKQLWAPELHHIDGKWYFFFAADDGNNFHHRIYVLENPDTDPTTTHWIFKGKLATKDDHWAIDLTTFEYKGSRYAVWSGWKGRKNDGQNLYIARMENPWTFNTPRILISKPERDWEKHGDLNPPDGKIKHLDINEGPEALQHEGRLYLVYSASGCWTDNYALGMLTLAPGGDPLNPHDWSKSAQPVFQSDSARHAYGTGHNGFFTSPDGKQNWIIYHANPEPHLGCANHRSTRAQPFTWNADGTPDFGTPVPLDQPVPFPSGELQ